MKQIGKFTNGCFNWLIPELSKSAMVYMLSFRKGGIYVGSTGNIKKRVNGFISPLKRGYYQNKKVQQAFDESREFEVFMLEELETSHKNTHREQFYINILHPELNGTNIACTQTLYSLERYRDELFCNNSINMVNCPHCGKPIEITLGAK